jgi:Tol biopolymer transport system component
MVRGLLLCAFFCALAGSETARAEVLFCGLRDTSAVVVGAGGRVYLSLHGVSEPCLAPNGQTVAVTKVETKDPSQRSLWLFSLDKKPAQRVSLGGNQSAYGALWLPDGKHLVFNVWVEGTPYSHWEVGLTDNTGANFRLLTAKLPHGKHQNYSVSGWNLKSGAVYATDSSRLFEIDVDGNVKRSKPLVGWIESEPMPFAANCRCFVGADGHSTVITPEIDPTGEEDEPLGLFLADWNGRKARRIRIKSGFDDLWMEYSGKAILLTTGPARGPQGVYRFDLQTHAIKLALPKAENGTATLDAP